MSTKAAMTFAERIVTDERFQRGAHAAVDGRSGASAVDALIEYAAAQGLTVTRAELERIRGVMLPTEELDENSLATVAGGVTLASAQPNVPNLEAHARDHLDAGSSAGDDAEVMSYDLQTALQKQQQTMQMLSTISKQQQDTAQAIIRNTKG
jgi:hypothetical protein